MEGVEGQDIVKGMFRHYRGPDKRAARQTLCERCAAKDRRAGKTNRWEPNLNGWECDQCGTRIWDYGVNTEQPD